MAIKSPGSLWSDLQFGPTYDQQKANRLIETLRSSSQTIAQLVAAVNALEASSGGTVPKHELAGETGLGPSHTVSGLVAGQVLIALGEAAAEFAKLKFSNLDQVDEASFEAPANLDVIQYVDGFWVAQPIQGGISIPPPGVDALLMYDVAAEAYRWAMPDPSIDVTAGAVAVNPHAIVHGELADLLADDHPQYGLLAGLNTWIGKQTFEGGFDAQADSTLEGNLAQSASEAQRTLTDTDADPNEASTIEQAEPGMLNVGIENADGSTAENWLSVTRIDDVVDQINLQGNQLTFNGDDLVSGTVLDAPENVPATIAGYVYLNIAGRVIKVPFLAP